MAKPPKFQAIRGTRDLLPPETELWNRVEETARSVFATFGFGEIRPPIMETLGLFARSLGEETDIVGKEMFLLAERESSIIVHPGRFGAPPESESDRRAEVERVFSEPEIRERVEQQIQESVLALRPEATASVCRAYIEHNMQQLPQPVKLYYMGPMFRRERPQKGRYRQFYQIGAEVLEASRPEPATKNDSAEGPALATRHSPLATLLRDAATDAEVIEMVMTFFDRLKLPGVQLDINSIGHAADDCRRGYVATLKAALEEVKDRLGADSQRRIETNPLRVLDSKLEQEQPIIATLPRIADHLCDDCKAHYAAVKRQLELRGVLYKENWRLVRGLDYYMRTTFEITAQGLGSQNAVCGGGRYDGLVELLGGPPTKGIGFAIGEDRLILSLQEGLKSKRDSENSPLGTGLSPLVYIAWMGERAYAAAIRAAKDLRTAGVRVELPPAEQKFGKALERASKLGSRYALILGDNEVSEGLWTLKTLADGSQQKLTEPELLDSLKRSCD